MKHILEVDSIQLSFGERKILSDVYIKCETGRITGLLGRNGQGKSCLMRIIHGSLPAEKSIRFDQVSNLHAYKRPDLLMYLPQFNFIPGQLSLKRIFSDFDISFELFIKRFPDFEKFYASRISSLSGGNRRFIELYIIIKAKSCFAMLDEPFSHLSPLQVNEVIDLLKEEKRNKGFLITDHMFKHIVEVSDLLYILVDGKTHLSNKTEDIELLGYARL